MNWQNKPILDAGHQQQLELLAAKNEFIHKLPRHQAEAKAYVDYIKSQHEDAAAHHLASSRAALALGDHDTAQKHGALYAQHVEKAGYKAMGPVPPEVTAKLSAVNRSKAKFKAHTMDQALAVKQVDSKQVDSNKSEK